VTGDRYVQHSHPVPDGKEGFKQFFAAFVEREPDRRMDVVRGFQDRQLVFLHVVQVLRGEPAWVTMDIFDTDDRGRLVEHWDVISAWQDLGSGRSPVDGPTEATDLHQTEDNKNLVRRLLEDVLMAGRTDLLPAYVDADRYVEHSPRLLGGPPGLLARPDRSADQEPGDRYHSTRLLLGHGDFVAALSHGRLAGADSAVVDLFRVEQGAVVEHWDSAEEIVPEDQWVNTGKF
jgi:predicted SnoaL-like aldol condensation-catalyzing enzyme